MTRTTKDAAYLSIIGNFCATIRWNDARIHLKRFWKHEQRMGAVEKDVSDRMGPERYCMICHIERSCAQSLEFCYQNKNGSFTDHLLPILASRHLFTIFNAANWWQSSTRATLSYVLSNLKPDVVVWTVRVSNLKSELFSSPRKASNIRPFLCSYLWN